MCEDFPCPASHLLVPAVIGLRHVMSHGGTLKSKGNQKLLHGETKSNRVSFQSRTSCKIRRLRRTYLDTPLWVQCDFNGCGQHLWLPLPVAYTTHTHLCGVDCWVQVLWGSEVGHLQPLWDGGVFHHRCSDLEQGRN